MIYLTLKRKCQLKPKCDTIDNNILIYKSFNRLIDSNIKANSIKWI